MPNLAWLSRIPVVDAYNEQNRINDEATAASTREVVAKQGILASLAAQQEKARARAREEALAAELQGLGPNPTREQLAGLGARYVRDPVKLMEIQERALGRAEDRASRESVAAHALSAQKAQRQEMMEFRYDDLSRREQEARTRSEDRSLDRASREAAAKQADTTRRYLGGLMDAARREGLELRRDLGQQSLELRRDINAQKTERVATEQEASVNNVSANMNRLAQEANRLLAHPGLSKTTGIRSIVPLIGGLATVPGTDAANFKAGLETLKSQAGFSVLQAMRDASKTGGALGQVSDFENRMLQANLGALDTAQSEDEFKAALNKIITYTEEAKERLRNAAKSAPAAPTGASGVPTGVDPKIWAVMTPGEKALWQK